MMFYDSVIRALETAMQKVKSIFEEELKTLRTQQLETSVLENLKVTYYGAAAPLNKLAQITLKDPTTVVITPFDKNALADIELAITNLGAGFNPTNDGTRIRIKLSPLTGEKRQELASYLHQKAEQSRIALRNARKQAWDEIQAMYQKKEISEDDRYRAEDQLNKMIEQYNEEVEKLTSLKEKEILQV